MTRLNSGTQALQMSFTYFQMQNFVFDKGEKANLERPVRAVC